MYRNPYWIGFLALIGSCTFAYTIYAFYLVYQYDRLTHQVPLSHIEWSISSVSDEEFVPEATYQFVFKGVLYQGHTVWNEHFLNDTTAKESIERAQSTKAWIDLSQPHYSSLQKNFPFKQCAYMLFLWILVIYFIGLGQYVKSYYPK